MNEYLNYSAYATVNISLTTHHKRLNRAQFYSLRYLLGLCDGITTTHNSRLPTHLEDLVENKVVFLREHTQCAVHTPRTKPSNFFSTFSFAATQTRPHYTSNTPVLKLFLGQRTDLHSRPAPTPRACSQRESCVFKFSTDGSQTSGQLLREYATPHACFHNLLLTALLAFPDLLTFVHSTINWLLNTWLRK